MQVKFSINPRQSAQFEATEYKSLQNNQIEIKGFVPVSDLCVNIKIVASVKDLQKDNNGLEFTSFDSVLKSYPQAIANNLQALILDLGARGENESAWFDFKFEMSDKVGGGIFEYHIYTNANDFDWVAYYNSLQAEKSNMLLNGGGFDAMQSVKQNNGHESFLPILGAIFKP